MPGLIAIIATAVLSQAPGAPDVVRTCNDAPAGAGLAAVGLFEQQPARAIDGYVLLDVSENGCAPTSPRSTAIDPGVTDGLQLRTVPGGEGTGVPKGTAARATLVADRGRHFTSYSAVFAVRRSEPGYALRLTAVAVGGEREVLDGCEAQAPCDISAQRQTFDLPPDTVRLEWSLECEIERCSRAATGDPATRGLAASLNVYGSTAVLK